jgi:tight adherence protein C
MSTTLLIAVVAIFFSVAIGSAAAANFVLRTAPERRRFRQVSRQTASGLVIDAPGLTQSLSPLAERISGMVSKSPRELSAVRRRMITAGYRNFSAAVWFSAAKVILPLTLALAGFLSFGLGRAGWLSMGVGAVLGFLGPDLWLDRKTRQRQKLIRNGLPDALDLLIVCLEAGSSLDQAIVKASEELRIAHPDLADELRLITTEIRAGKPRLEAFKNFADRTRVQDVRSLVGMLAQTDRFGTSVAQALRTHAETSRTKRRQRAEERAAKVGVKLVFPLIFLLFPALYVVILGPAVIKFIRIFVEQAMQRNLNP